MSEDKILEEKTVYAVYIDIQKASCGVNMESLWNMQKKKYDARKEEWEHAVKRVQFVDSIVKILGSSKVTDVILKCCKGSEVRERK